MTAAMSRIQKAIAASGLADEELAQTEYDEWVRAKVATARADKRPGMTADKLRQALEARGQELANDRNTAR